jgi:hypothetical protein
MIKKTSNIMLCLVVIFCMTACKSEPRTPFEILNIDADKIDKVQVIRNGNPETDSTYMEDQKEIEKLIDYCKTFKLEDIGGDYRSGNSLIIMFFIEEKNVGGFS